MQTSGGRDDPAGRSPTHSIYRKRCDHHPWDDSLSVSDCTAISDFGDESLSGDESQELVMVEEGGEPPDGISLSRSGQPLTPARPRAARHAGVSARRPTRGPGFREIGCTNPRCQFLVHTDARYGSFCCMKCCWVYDTGSKTKKKHAHDCEARPNLKGLTPAPEERPTKEP